MNLDAKILNKILTECNNTSDRTQEWFNIHITIYGIHYINKMKTKNHIIVSIDAEQAFDKNQHHFLLKTLSKIGIGGMFHNTIKATCEKPQCQHHAEEGKAGSFSTKMQNQTRMSTCTIAGRPSQSYMARKGNQRNSNGK